MFGRMWKAVETETGKSRMVKTKEKRKKKEARKRQEGKKQKKERKMEVRRISKEWEIWDKKKEAVRLEKKAKKLVLEKFHKWINVFGKKQSERMPTQKLWDHTIDMKKVFVLRKRKVYLLLRKKRGEV